MNQTVEYIKEKFPDKNTEDSLEKELKYCKQLIDVVKGNEAKNHMHCLDK